jgi:Rad3-related DNA helicase
MVWSLYEKTSEEKGIFDYSSELLEPLKFSNGKTQEDVVNETLELIKKGKKIIFIEGVCGSGKSAIALNLAKNFKKTSIVVPIKSLQEQYEKDYTNKKFVLKDNKKPLKISVIKGRNNFSCPYSMGERCDSPDNPCTIEIREKNTTQLMNYLRENPFVDENEFSSVSDIKRMNIAPCCPYWAPIMPSDVNPKSLGEYKKVKFDAVAGKEYALFQRKKGCQFYDQYESYANSDVLIFNATKYLIESSMQRKPKTDIEIIDECDEFLDSFANEKKININRLVLALSTIEAKEKENKSLIKDLIFELNNLIFQEKETKDCEKLLKTNFSDLFEKIIDNPYLAQDEELNYYNSVFEILKSFEKIKDDTYISFERYKKDPNQQTIFKTQNKDNETLTITLVSINLQEKFRELLEQNKVFVLMSGTLHSKDVLKDIFGLSDFEVIEAETKTPGIIKKYRTGLEKNCSYANFKSGGINRNTYLKILDVCLLNAEKPLLVHVTSFGDLPSSKEYEDLKLENLITQERLKELQQRAQNQINDFKTKRLDTLFTTKCSRGADFPGDECKSIIMTRFPYPNISSLFWKILKKEQPEKFMEFYMDKAKRELIQKISRGVRFKGDCVNLLSPDLRVINQNLL